MQFPALVAVVLLAACAGTPPGISAGDGRQWNHRCPPAGTVVQTSINTRLVYAEAAGPGVCRRRDGLLQIYGVWRAPSAEPQIVSWLAPLFPAAAGRSSTTSVVSPDRLRNNTMYRYDARVLGFETLALPAGTFDTVVIEWTRTGAEGAELRVRYRRWVDTNTGALVRYEDVTLGGSNPELSWHAVSLVTPAGTPP